MRLAGRRAVVTGAGSGIGRAIAARFAGEGASVVVADIDVRRGADVAAEITESGGRAMALQVDVADERSVTEMCARSIAELDGVDILVNNASSTPSDDLLAMRTADWERDIGINLRGPYLCTREVLPGMIERGRGCIVNVASVNALGFYGNEAYSAAKAGLISLTRSVAVRHGRNGIRANVVAPATVRTPIWEERLRADPDVLTKAAGWYPLQRVGEPDDVAAAALFLASDEASWITGVVLPIDGGLTAGSYRMTSDLVSESDF